MNLGLQPISEENNYPRQSGEVVQLFDLHRFLAGFPIVEFKKNQVIYNENDPSDALYFIESGCIITGVRNEGREDVITALLFKKQLFGEQGLAGKRIRGEFAQAKEKTRIIVVPLTLIRKMMLEHGAFSLSINQLILKKLCFFHEKWRTQIIDYARTRVIDFITFLVENNGRRVGLEWTVDQFFPHREIASIIGSSRQTVTVTLNELRQKDIIYFDRKRLIVRDLEALKKERIQ